MEDMKDVEARFLKILAASPEQLVAIDKILAGQFDQEQRDLKAPLLVGMGAGARLLGLSRATMWRMIKAGRLRKVEVLPGSFRLRLADLEAIAYG